MAGTSVHQERAAGTVECYRCDGDECAKCGGTGERERRRCEGCGVPSGRPSEGGEALIGLRNRRGAGQPLYCGECHPEDGADAGLGLAMLEGLGA